jgi:hypothetical protein
VSVTTPSTSDVPLSTATAFLVASATTSAPAAAAARPEPATRRSEWKGRAGEDGVAKVAAGGAAAAMVGRRVGGVGCWLAGRTDGRTAGWLAADKVGPALVKQNTLFLFYRSLHNIESYKILE